MKKRLCLPLAAIVMCGFMATFPGCSDNDDKYQPLSFPDVRDGVITLKYPLVSGYLIGINGGTPPYKVTCESDILKVKIYEEAPDYFVYEALGVGEATVIVSDAVGETARVPVVVEYNDIMLTVMSRDAEVTGDNLTIAEHAELKEKAMAAIPVDDGGIYRLVYTGKESGTLYVHKKAIDAYRYEGAFETLEQEGGFLKGSTFSFEFDNEVHIFRVGSHWPHTRVEYTPRYALYEDLTEQFLGEYPGLESLTTIHILKD